MTERDIKTETTTDSKASAESESQSIESILSEANGGPEGIDEAKKDEDKRIAAEAKKGLSKEELKPEVHRPAMYVATEGAEGRDGGPYLDREQRREQEILNARREGREPDFKNPAFAPSTVLVPEKSLRAAVDTEVTVKPALAKT